MDRARTRNGFVPQPPGDKCFRNGSISLRPACPFISLPETKRSRFGEELNAERI